MLSHSCHTDDNGEYAEVYVPGGTFLIDCADLAYAMKHRWRIYQLDPACNNTKYVCRSKGPKGGNALIHREIMKAPTGVTVDHIDGNSRNNRRHNLRLASGPQNTMNVRNRSVTGSGHRGVYPTSNGKFYVTARFGGKLVYIGTFDTILEASSARDREVVRRRGEFGFLNSQIDRGVGDA